MTATEKKYEILRGQSKQWMGRTLYRVRRLSDGLVGGWVQSEKNLSQKGDCFIYDEAKVFDKAKVFEDASIRGCAWVRDNSKVFGSACVSGNALVDNLSSVFDRAKVFDNAQVYDRAKVYGSATVREDARVFDSSHACGDADVFSAASLRGGVVAAVPVLFCEMTRHNITAAERHICVGCEVHTLEDWEQNIEEIGKKSRYSDKEIAMYREVIFDFIKTRRSQGF